MTEKRVKLKDSDGNILKPYNPDMQDKLVSGTNIKTINSESILGSGDITIKSAPDLDGKTITKNSSEELQAVAVIDANAGDAIKTWSGTTDEYNAIADKDSNTLYNITDDFTATAYEAYSKSESDAKFTTESQVDSRIMDIMDNSSYGFPSANYINLTLGDSGDLYTAPADGWVTVRGSTSASNGRIEIISKSAEIRTKVVNPISSNSLSCFLPLRKGNSYWVYYANATLSMYFVYAESFS